MFTVALLNTAALFSTNLVTSWPQEPEGTISDLRLASTQRGTLTNNWDAVTDWRSSMTLRRRKGIRMKDTFV